MDNPGGAPSEHRLVNRRGRNEFEQRQTHHFLFRNQEGGGDEKQAEQHGMHRAGRKQTLFVKPAHLRLFHF
jgi:hypothetical protein